MSRNATLVQIVADELEKNLRDGVYVCGERLIEMTIAAEMNVSQNTVREALRVLEQAGWVVKRARHGVSVRSFTIDETQEVYDLREALERMALIRAMDVMTEAQKMLLAQIIAEARIRANVGNNRGVREAIFKFHETIIAVTGRPQTIQILNRLLNQARLLANLRSRHDPDDSDIHAERLTLYGDLVTQIRYGDTQLACGVLHDLLIAERDSLLSVLDLV